MGPLFRHKRRLLLLRRSRRRQIDIHRHRAEVSGPELQALRRRLGRHGLLLRGVQAEVQVRRGDKRREGRPLLPLREVLRPRPRTLHIPGPEAREAVDAADAEQVRLLCQQPVE